MKATQNTAADREKPTEQDDAPIGPDPCEECEALGELPCFECYLRGKGADDEDEGELIADGGIERDVDLDAGSEVPGDLEKRDVRALTEMQVVVMDVPAEGMARVHNETATEEYVVDVESGACTCKDAQHNHPENGCKHARRARFIAGLREIPAWVNADDLDGVLRDKLAERGLLPGQECDVCGERFASEHGVAVHQGIEHADDDDESDEESDDARDADEAAAVAGGEA